MHGALFPGSLVEKWFLLLKRLAFNISEFFSFDDFFFYIEFSLNSPVFHVFTSWRCIWNQINDKYHYKSTF